MRGWMEIGDLRLLTGKHLLIVERGDLVADEVRLALEQAGVVIVGPASSVEIGLALLYVVLSVALAVGGLFAGFAIIRNFI